MSEEPKQTAPKDVAKDWLYAFEQCVRSKDYEAAGQALHKNCVYFGMPFETPKEDWRSNWPDWDAFSIDMANTKFIPEGNLIMGAATWVARKQIIGAPIITGRLTVCLMRFTFNKILAIHMHWSKQP